MAISCSILCASAQASLERIRGEIAKARENAPAPLLGSGVSSSKPRRNFVEDVQELFESLLRRGDFREIEKFPRYLAVLSQVQSKIAGKAPVEEVRALQVGAGRI